MQQTGEAVASGKLAEAVQVFEGNRCFRLEAVDMKNPTATDHVNTCPLKGRCFWSALEAPGFRVPQIARVYRNPKPGYEAVRDRIGF
jgi:uncharacterized protein (DUF427 family)